jgi:hypothetical protein
VNENKKLRENGALSSIKALKYNVFFDHPINEVGIRVGAIDKSSAVKR